MTGPISRNRLLGSLEEAAGWPGADRNTVVAPPAELTFMAQRAHSKATYVTAGHLSMITQPHQPNIVLVHGPGPTDQAGELSSNASKPPVTK
jgi:hypothetical protein